MLAMFFNIYLNSRLLCGILDWNSIVTQEVGSVAIICDKLWELYVDKKIKRTELKSLAGVSTSVIAKVGKNESTDMEILVKICAALSCAISDIVKMNGDLCSGVKQ